MKASQPLSKSAISVIALCIFSFSLCFTSYAQNIYTTAGNGYDAGFNGGYSGDGGPATAAEIFYPASVVKDASGNLYIADGNNNRIRKVNTSGIITTIAGNGYAGYSGDGGRATAAEISDPSGVAIDASGNIYIADYENYVIRKVSTSGVITTIAGNGQAGYSGDGGQATAAEISDPERVAIDASGNVYIADSRNDRIRKVNTSGIISTFAGNGHGAYSGDGGQATAAELNFPVGMALDASGNFYIGDENNDRIRKINTSGIISTIAGNGIAGYSGDGGAATASELHLPEGVAADASGNVYIADWTNHCIREVNTSGIISTVAGNGNEGYSGDGGPATAAELFYPAGVAIDAYYNVYIADLYGNRIREVQFLNTNVISNVICNGGSTGNASVMVSGGTSPYTYSWSNGGTAAVSASNPTGAILSAGTYTLIITDNKKETATTLVTITQPYSLGISSSSSTNNSSCTGGNGTASAVPSGGTSPYTYSWSGGGQTNTTATELAAGTYSLTITDNCGASTGVSVTVGQTISTLAITISPITNVSCYNADNGSVTATGTGGVQPYTYSWNDPANQTTPTASNLGAGTYTVTATDNNGCTASTTATITQPSVVNATVGGIQNATACANNGQATVTPGGGNGGYTYLWSDGNSQTNATATGLSGGVYSVTVSDVNNCSATASVTITQSSPVNATVGGIQNATACANNGQATVTPGGGNGGYTYLWSDGNSQTNATATGLSGGFYSVTVSDVNNCSATASVTITQPAPVNATVGGIQNATACANNGQATVTPGGGNGGYTYLWSDGNSQTTATATGLSGGVYTVTVSDINNCSGVASVTITQASAITASASVNQNATACSNAGSATVTAGGGNSPYTYSWNDNSNQDAATASNLSAGDYTVTVTDNNGCFASVSVTITQPAFPLALSLTSVTDINCNGGTGNATVQVNPPVTKTFKYEAAIQHLAIPANALTTVTVSVTGAGGGTDEGNFNGGSGTSFSGLCSIIPGDILSIVIGGGGGQGGTSLAGGGGGGTFVYDSNLVLYAPSGTTGLFAVAGGGGGGGLNNGGANGGTNLNTSAASNGNSGGGTAGSGGNGGSVGTAGGGGGGGWLTNGGGLTGSSQSNGGKDEANHFVGGSAVSSGYAGGFGGGGSSVSNGGAGGGGGGYNGGGGGSGGNESGGGGGGSFLAGGTTNLLSSVSATHSGNGSASITYMMPVTGTPPYTYSWSPSGGTNPSASGLTAGTYTCTATDNSGCTATVAITITQVSALTATMGIPTNDTKACANTGSATVTAGGGTNPYTYSWSNGQTKSTATSLSGGTYTVTVKDKNDCISTASVTITQPSAVTAAMGTPVNSIACANTGSATVTAGGGTIPYTYSWNDPSHQVTATASNLSGGSYTVTVKDGGGCTASAFVTISQPSTLTATMGTHTNNAKACVNTGSASVISAGGNSPYTYSWNDNSNQTTVTASNLSGGSYTVTVTDNSGCTASASVTITQPSAVIATMGTPVNSSACANNGQATVTPGGGNGGYTYLWNDGASQTNATATGLSGGVYTVTVSDVNSCSATASVTITQSSPVNATIGGVQNATACANNGQATVTPGGGNGGYTYLWNDGASQTNATATGLSGGVYTVTVSDVNSCSATASVTITQSSPLNATIGGVQNATACANNGQATVTPGGGNGGYTYLWNDGDSQTNAMATGLSGGVYTVTVSDVNSCSATASVTITQSSPVNATIGGIQNATACANNGQATVTPSGGNGGYTYLWNDGASQTNATATGLSGGIYIVTITDVNSCSATTSVTITQSSPVNATIGGIQNATACANNGQATVTPGGGNGGYSYLWNDGASQTNATATGLSGGIYIVTITDVNNCSATASVTITQSSPVSASIGGVQNATACANNGQATVTPGGGNDGYTYLWNDGDSQTNAMATGLSGGVYTVTVSDVNSCSATASVTITQSSPVNATIGGVQNATACTNNGQATVTPGGGNGGYTYLWNDGASQTNATATGLSGGVYTVTVSDVNSCSATASVTITQSGPVNATIVGIQNATACANNGQATVTPGGGNGGYTYLWNDGASQSTATASNLSGGNYIVTITDNSGCSATASVTITQPSAIGITISSVANATCGGTGSITANAATGGNPPYTYSWSNGGGNNLNASYTAGTYTLTVTDNNGCTAMASAVITQSAAMSATSVITANVSCNGATTGSASVTPSGGTSPYTYSWSPTGGSNATASGLSAGTYIVYVSGNGGCSATVSVTITQPSEIIAGQQKIIGLTYAGGTNGAGAIFGYSLDSNRESVLWNLQGGTDGDQSYDRLILDPNNGLYYATTSGGGTNNGGTIIKFNPATNSETVVWNFGGTGDGTNAQGSLIFYAPTGLFYGMTTNNAGGSGPGVIFSFDPATNTETVLWTLGTGSDGANPFGTLVLDPSSNILYGVTYNGGSNGNGAIISFNPSTGSEYAVYSFSNLPDAQHPYSSMIFNTSDGNFYGLTQGGGANTGPNGPDGTIFKFNPTTNTETVLWSFGNGTDAYQPNGTLVYNPANNLYYGMSTYGGTTNDGAIFSFDPSTDAESVVFSFQTPPDGHNPFGDMTYNSSDGLFYGVTPYGGEYNNAGILFSFNPLSNSESILWNFGNGSDGAYSFAVGGLEIINGPGAVALQNASCNGGSNGNAQAFFTGGSGSYSYKWSNGISSIVSTSNPTGNVLSAGTYTVTATDGNGCTATASVAITQPLLLGVSISSLTNAACGGTGSITANAATGGTSPYTYSWSNAGGTNLNATFSAGTYTIFVTDNNGCTAMASATITQSVLSASAVVTNNVSCNGGSAGSASVTLSGGTSPYTYSWSPRGGSNVSATGLSAGTYTVHVSGNGGCTATATVVITQPGSVSIATTVTEISCNGSNTGKAVASVSGGTSPYTYSWSPTGGSAATASGLSAGTYTIQVTSNSGCTATASGTITQPAAVSPAITSSNGTNFCSSLNTTLGTQYTGNDALQFNGSTTYCTVADAADMDFGTSTNFTVEGWINFTASETNYTGLVAKGQTSSGIWTGWQLVLYGNKIASEIQSPLGYVGPGSTELIGTTALNDGNWHHVALTVNRSTTTATLYVDGAQQSTFTSSYIGGTVTYNGNALIGVDRQSRLHFNGKMDEFRIWNIAMTQAQIQASMNTAVQKNSAGLVAYYRMDNGTGTAANDLTGNGNNATLVNSPSWIASTAPVGQYAGYSWSNSATGSATTVSSAGTYTVSVTDVNGCTGTGNVSLSLSIVTANVTTTNITCNGSNNGSAHSSPSGGTSPYTYSWSPTGGSGASATGLSAGTYTVHITSNSGCTATVNVIITQPTIMSVSTIVTGVSCRGGNTGKATANASGGTSPYTYSWSPSEGSNAIASGLSAGTYTIHLTSNNGCTATANAIITQPTTVFTVSTTVAANVTCNGGSTGIATASASGGTSPYTYSWSPNGGSGAAASGLSAGTYTVQVSSNSGCTLTASVIITQPVAMSVSTTATGVTCNGGGTGKATVSASGGVSPYTYSWSPSGGSGATASGLSAGTYTVHVTSHAGCATTATVTVTQPVALSETQFVIDCNNGKVTTAILSVTGGVAPYTYSWSPTGGTKDTAVGLTAGTYTVKVTDHNGCSVTLRERVSCGNSPVKIGGNDSAATQCCQGLQNVILYPNPNNGQFSITGIEKGIFIEVYDYTGRKISAISANDETMQLNISNQPNGIYLIRIIDKDGNLVSQKKVVKVK